MARSAKLFALTPAVLMLSIGCGKDTSTDTGAPDSDGPGDRVYLELAQGLVHANATDLGEFPGWVGVPNLDDDDQNGTADFEQAGVEGDNDLATAWLQTAGRDVKLSLSGSTQGIRLYHDGEFILGGDGATEAVIAAAAEPVELQVEFNDFLKTGTLLIMDEERGEEFSIALTAAPLILNHHLQEAIEVMAMDINFQGYSNKEMIDAYVEKLGNNRFIEVDYNTYDGDPWVQDEFEFGYINAPDIQIDFIFDTLRNGQGQAGRGLDNFPEDQYEGPDWLIDWWGRGSANSLDYGGNLEISPPVEVAGVAYPYGRIYYGGAGGYMPKEQTRDALDSMRIQKPFLVDSTWLCVGHVDEYTTTIPDPSSPKGFRFVIADTHAAWEILEKMDPTTRLTRYRPGGYNGHSIANVRAIVEDNALRSLNEEVQDILDSEKAKFVAELGLTEEDILYMPALFEEPRGCGSYVAALIPGGTNLIVAEEKDGSTALFIPDPFMRTDVDDQSTDPVIAAIRESFPASLNLHFVDDWEVYHMGLGEVHCGSNVRRDVTSEWWIDGAHLLEDGE